MHKAIRLAVAAAVVVVVIAPILIVAAYQAFIMASGGGRSRLPPVTAADVEVKNKCRSAAERYLAENSPDGWFEIVREPNQNVPLQRIDGWWDEGILQDRSGQQRGWLTRFTYRIRGPHGAIETKDTMFIVDDDYVVSRVVNPNDFFRGNPKGRIRKSQD